MVDALVSRSRLATCCAPAAIISADFAAVSVLAPRMRAGLGLDATELAWVVSGFSAGYGALLVAAGGWADSHGRRCTLLAGLGIFAAGAATVSVATNAETAIAARVLQGVGAAIMFPAGLALATAGAGAAQSRATAAYGMALAAGFVAGTLTSGVLATLGSWRAGMAITALSCVAAAASARRLAEPAASGAERGVSASVALAVGCLVGAGTLASALGGWAGIALPAAAVAALAAFGGRLGHAATGRASPAALACAASTAIAATAVAALLLLTLLLQDDRGYTPLATSLVFTCFGAAAVPAARAARRMCATRRAGAAVAVGLAAQGAALLAAMASADAAIVACVAGFGFGHVLGNAAAASLALEDAPHAVHGALTGTVGAAQRLGAALGPVLTARLASDFRGGMAVSGVTALAAAALIALASRRPR
jgi:MFS family permease